MSPRIAVKKPRSLRPEEIEALEKYAPKVIPAARWGAIRSYVLEAVRTAGPYSEGHARKDLHKLARYVDWAHHVMGRPLSHEDVFDHELIAYYAVQALPGYGQASRATTRSALLWFADHLVPAQMRMVTLERMGRTHVSHPYTQAQVDRMTRWATEQRTPYKRHACWTALVFGLGAGLRTSELDGLRREDVVADEAGVLVHVRTGSSPRVVPMLAQWEQHALVLAECVAEGAFIFKPERDGPRVKDVGFTLHKSAHQPEFPVNMQRMRTTWLVRLLNAGVPVQLVAQAAGMAGLTGIERLFEFLDPVPAEAARAVLREDCRERSYARVSSDREANRAQQRAYYRAAQELARQVAGAHGR